MGDHSGSADVGVPAGQLFDYLSEVSNLPRYFTAMTSAELVGQDEVHVGADVDRVTRKGQAWFRVDRERRHLPWGSEGPADSGDIDRDITGTPAGIKRLAEAGPAPRPAS